MDLYLSLYIYISMDRWIGNGYERKIECAKHNTEAGLVSRSQGPSHCNCRRDALTLWSWLAGEWISFLPQLCFSLIERMEIIEMTLCSGAATHGVHTRDSIGITMCVNSRDARIKLSSVCSMSLLSGIPVSRRAPSIHSLRRFVASSWPWSLRLPITMCVHFLNGTFFSGTLFNGLLNTSEKNWGEKRGK